MKTCPVDSGIKNQAAGITTVAGADFRICRDLLKVRPSQPVDLKALRAAARSQFLCGNRQVAMPAAQARPCQRHQR